VTGNFLRIRDLCKTFTPEGKTVRALDGFSLDIDRGSFTAVAGKSGCGKTTLLKCVAGLEKPGSGAVEFAAETRIGFMFQDPRLLPWLTVEGNLRLALPRKGGALRGMSSRKGETGKHTCAFRPERKLGAKGDTSPPIVKETLALVGLDGWEKAYPAQLSGGMAQRASLARCLCRKPEFLLLDEPLSALDFFTRLRLRRELAEIRERLGLTVMLVTHDIEEAVYLGDRVVLMEAGRLAAEFAVPLERPRDYHDGAFQTLCAEIERKAGETK
jgi:sulfonate transport system ATP-binding protein